MLRRFYYKQETGEVTFYTNGGFIGCSDPWVTIDTTALQETALSRNHSLRIDEKGVLKIIVPPHKALEDQKELFMQKAKAGSVTLADVLAYLMKT